MFQKADFGLGQGGAPASAWLVDSVAAPASYPVEQAFRATDWRSRLRDWSEDVELVPDLGQRIGSGRWYRGLATLSALLIGAFQLYPGAAPFPDRPAALLPDAQFEEVRSQMITPLALGADSGRHMGPTSAVVPLNHTPERPRIEVSTILDSGAGFSRSLSRAGVGTEDRDRISALLAGTANPAALAPGTRLDIILGRRSAPTQPRPLERLAFRARLDLAVEIERVEGALALKPIPIAVDNTPLRIRGTVGDSLYRSARAAGVPASAVQSYLRVLGQHMPVSRLSPNDRFDIILGYRRAATGEVEVGSLLYAGLDRTRGKNLQLLKWSSGGRTQWFEASGVGERRGLLTMPVSGARMSSNYGVRRHPVLGIRRMHSGIDFAARHGTPIYAAADGVISFSGWNGGYGRFVRINHGNGLGTGYAHMSRVAAKRGQRVKRGQVIGYVGSTGLSTGPHLHYELYRNGRTINPRSVSFVTNAQLAGNDLRAFRTKLAEMKRLRIGMPSPVSTHAGQAVEGKDVSKPQSASLTSNDKVSRN